MKEELEIEQRQIFDSSRYICLNEGIYGVSLLLISNYFLLQ
jgi:hypothetical protein